jgi:hypothetical protein
MYCNSSYPYFLKYMIDSFMFTMPSYTVDSISKTNFFLWMLWTLVTVLRSQLPVIEDDDVVQLILLFLKSIVTHLHTPALPEKQEWILPLNEVVYIIHVLLPLTFLQQYKPLFNLSLGKKRIFHPLFRSCFQSLNNLLKSLPWGLILCSSRVFCCSWIHWAANKFAAQCSYCFSLHLKYFWRS